MGKDNINSMAAPDGASNEDTLQRTIVLIQSTPSYPRKSLVEELYQRKAAHGFAAKQDIQALWGNCKKLPGICWMRFPTGGQRMTRICKQPAFDFPVYCLEPCKALILKAF